MQVALEQAVGDTAHGFIENGRSAMIKLQHAPLFGVASTSESNCTKTYMDGSAC